MLQYVSIFFTVADGFQLDYSTQRRPSKEVKLKGLKNASNPSFRSSASPQMTPVASFFLIMWWCLTSLDVRSHTFFSYIFPGFLVKSDVTVK